MIFWRAACAERQQWANWKRELRVNRESIRRNLHEESLFRVSENPDKNSDWLAERL